MIPHVHIVSTTRKKEITEKFYFILFQLCIYFTGIGFSAGGGNYPGRQTNNFGIYKGLFIFLPVLITVWLFVLKPYRILQQLSMVFKLHKYLLLYIAISFVLLPFAVSPGYSFMRLLYNVFEYTGLIALLIQINLNYPFEKMIVLDDFIIGLSAYFLLFFFYVFCINGFIFTSFRFRLESLYLIHPNILAAISAHFFLWHSLHAYFKSNRKICHTLFMILYVLIEALLFSRTVIIGLLFILTLLPFISFLSYKHVKAFTAIIIIILGYTLLGIVLCFGGEEFFFSLLARNDSYESLLTLTNRTILWENLLSNLTIRGFFVGNGYSVIGEKFGVDFGTGILYGAHNMYLSVLFGSGIFALVSVVLYLFKNIKKLYRLKNIQNKETYYPAIASWLLFLLTGMSAEEIGINLSLTFSLVIFITTIIFLDNSRLQ